MDHIAASDCERCRPGLVAQPVNTASSLSFVLAGAMVLRSLRRRGIDAPAEVAVGWASAAAGLGSVAYHGPGRAFGRYLHDATLLNLLGTMAVADAAQVTGRPAPRSVLAAIPVVSLVAAHPVTSTAAQAVAGAVATATETARFARGSATRGARQRQGMATAVAGAGALAHLLGGTGGPWCRPDSLLQPHAAWHASMAATIYLRGIDARHG